MDINDFPQLERDEHGNVLTITHDHDVYYANTEITKAMNKIYGDIFARVYVHIYNEYCIPTVRSNTHISLESANVIAERHNGSRILMTWSEWGNIQVI